MSGKIYTKVKTRAKLSNLAELNNFHSQMFTFSHTPTSLFIKYLAKLRCCVINDCGNLSSD